MIDIFMGSLLGALVVFGSVITIEPGVGAVAFCAVVILTMFAAETFEPRLMWDAAAERKPTIFSDRQRLFSETPLPVEVMVSCGAAIAGIYLTPPKDPLLHTPPASAMMKLQRLHAAVGRLAENAPEIIANPDAARGLEQALIEAVVG
jgi:hypothetical protein